MNIKIVKLVIALLIVFNSPNVWAEQPRVDTKEKVEESWLADAWNKFTIVPEPKDGQRQPKEFSRSIKCAVENFDLFFNLFSEDRDFQLSATPLPLKLSVYSPKYNVTQEELDAREDIVDEILYLDITDLYTSKASFFPNRIQRVNDNLFFSILHNFIDKTAVVKIFQQDTGVYIKFIFHWDGCWFLSEIESWST